MLSGTLDRVLELEKKGISGKTGQLQMNTGV